MRVLLVGAEEGRRARLHGRLSGGSGLVMVGEQSPGLGVLSAVQACEADVLLLLVGASLNGQLERCGPVGDLEHRPLVLVLGDLGQEDTERALRSGADAVVSPAVGSRHLARLVHRLAAQRVGASPGARQPGLTRRGFLGGALTGAAGAAALTLADARPATASSSPIPPRSDLDLPQDKEAMLVRMQQDLQRALKKPLEERRWAMVIDLRKCVGCSACTVACVAENHLPPGVVYRPVIEQEVGTYPNVSRQFLPRPCMQCDEPPCTDVCPVGATYKRPDGVVEINYDKCIGCRYCIAACPYGARTFDWGENWTDGTPSGQAYESAPSNEYGKRWPRKKDRSPIGNVRKCNFCLHRLNAGMLPACTTTCVGAATYFGDQSDPDSLIAPLIGSEHVERLKEDLGTGPNVYYLR